MFCRGTSVGIAPKQVDAELIEIVGNVGDDRGGSRWILDLLPLQDVERTTAKGQPPGQYFVEHYPDAVPVGGGRDGPAGRLLRRHVGHRPQQMRLRAVVHAGVAQIGGQPKIQQLDTAVGRYHHIAMLDIPVQLACLVQGFDA